MVRFVIIGIVIAVAFTLYALVDAAMTDGARARGVSKPVWVVLVVLLPVIGGVLWFMIGKGSPVAARPTPPDDDPRFTGTRISQEDLDARMRDLEEQLRALDEEVYPGEEPQTRDGAGAPDHADPEADDSTGEDRSGKRSGDEPQPGADDSESPQR